MFLKALIKFSIVGLSGVVVNAVVFNALLFMNFFDQHYLFANTLAFFCAVTNNFYWNFAWTFKGKAMHVSTSEKYVKFLVICIINFGVNTLLLGIMVDELHFHKRLANIIAIIFTSGLNFMGNYLVTFRDKR